jgi:hypothetical protein
VCKTPSDEETLLAATTIPRTAHHFWFMKLAALVLCMGAILHTARLLFGIGWVVQNFATPRSTWPWAVPLTFVVVSLWAFRGDVVSKNFAKLPA